jgi:general secretion pathway protein B
VPPLHLELHAYSERPAERFVFINGRKYVEGETLAEGPRLVAIQRTGVVLSQQGRRFLLTQ